MLKASTPHRVQVTSAPIAHFIFLDTRLAWVWLIARLYLSYTWITAGFEKLTGGGWIDGGSALKDFWLAALKTDPKPVITFDWYRQFIQFMEDTHGNFMMAGTASVNPVLFTLSVLLILAWKTAGYLGLDRFLLPWLGTPWKPGVTIAGSTPKTGPATV